MATFLGDSLWQQCQIAFGYLQTRGFCYNGDCRVFPVVVGETGSFMTDATDNQWLLDFADFVNARVSAQSARLRGFFALQDISTAFVAYMLYSWLVEVVCNWQGLIDLGNG